MFRLPASILTATLALAAFSGCSSSSGPSASTQDSDSGGLCASDPSLKTFGPGESAAGTHGYSFQLIEADPPTPTQVQDGNTWTIKVTNMADGGAMDGLTFGLKCAMKMPGVQQSHGCGFPPITPMGNGLYKVSRIVFNMPGHWDIQFSVLNGTAVVDSASIGTCIDQ